MTETITITKEWAQDHRFEDIHWVCLAAGAPGHSEGRYDLDFLMVKNGWLMSCDGKRIHALDFTASPWFKPSDKTLEADAFNRHYYNHVGPYGLPLEEGAYRVKKATLKKIELERDDAIQFPSPWETVCFPKHERFTRIDLDRTKWGEQCDEVDYKRIITALRADRTLSWSSFQDALDMANRGFNKLLKVFIYPDREVTYEAGRYYRQIEFPNPVCFMNGYKLASIMPMNMGRI